MKTSRRQQPPPTAVHAPGRACPARSSCSASCRRPHQDPHHLHQNSSAPPPALPASCASACPLHAGLGIRLCETGSVQPDVPHTLRLPSEIPAFAASSRRATTSSLTTVIIAGAASLSSSTSFLTATSAAAAVSSTSASVSATDSSYSGWLAASGAASGAAKAVSTSSSSSLELELD